MTEPMLICGACGVVRAARKAKCPHCTTPYEGALTVPPRVADAYWVCIECTFKCRACGFEVPLNHLDMDGGVLCARCGLEQAFDVSQWRRAIEHAHGTGDLWNDAKIHRERALVELGDRSCSRPLGDLGNNDFAIVASPGQPLCEKCHQPTSVQLDAESTRTGVSKVACACGETAAYEVPAAARAMAPSLAAILATEHRVDRKAVKVDQTAAAVAVACPSCSAPLEADETSKFLTCSYCHAVSRIPDRTWFRLSGKEPRPDPMWLLFRGVSREREELEARKREDERKADERARRDQESAARKSERARENEREKLEAEEQRRKASQRADLEDEEAKRKREAEGARQRGFIVAGVIAVLVVGGIVFYAAHDKKRVGEDPLSVAEAACLAGDGKACDRAGGLLSQDQFPELKLVRYASACDAKYAPGCTHRGRGAEEAKQYRSAATYYDRGCQGGDSAACSALDALYASGNATPRDPSTASLYFDRACANGKLESCVAGGLAYSEGRGVARDAPRAAGLFKKACDGGSARGCNLLAQACTSGNESACAEVRK